MASDVLASATTAATYDIALQMVFRLLTFVLNAFILRYISKDLLGVVNVRLTLLYTTILFVSREAFRRACMSKATADKQWTQLINLLWCIIPISLAFSCFFGYIWANILEQPDPNTVPYYKTAVILFAISSVIEIISEPLFITAQIILYVRLKVVIEGLAIAVRTIFTVILLILMPDYGVINFCIAQLLFTCTISAAYYIYFISCIKKEKKDQNLPFQSIRDIFPKIHIPFISFGLARLTWSFIKQSFLKQILNEGERYFMTVFSVIKLADQGIFDVVTNLGSLAGRFIFLPLESNGYLFFSQTLVRGQPALKQEKEALDLSVRVLQTLLKLVTWLGLTILSFGYSYSYLLLDLYGGTILSSGAGPPLLRWFCLYVVMMAVNGITECFASATMNESQLDAFNKKVLVSSVIYLLSFIYLCQLYGTVGLILANCVNYVARISFSIYHNHQFFQGTDIKVLRSGLPHLAILVTMLFCWIVTSISEVIFCCDQGLVYRMVHVIIGGVCLLILLIVTYISEDKQVEFIKQQYYQRKHKQS